MPGTFDKIAQDIKVRAQQRKWISHFGKLCVCAMMIMVVVMTATAISR